MGLLLEIEVTTGSLLGGLLNDYWPVTVKTTLSVYVPGTSDAYAQRTR